VPEDVHSVSSAALLLEQVTWDFRRALLWFRSSIMSWSEAARSGYEGEAIRLLILIWSQARAVTDLAQQSPDNFAPAPVLARAAFEAGLTCNWLLGSEDASICESRWLALQSEAAHRMHRVARHMDDAGFDGDRWRQGAIRRENLVAERALGGPRQRPNVVEMLQGLGLKRLYHGYMMASQWGHGTVLAGQEHDAGQPKPFSLNEWYLPFNMVLWGILFGARGFLQRPGGPGLEELQGIPLGDAQATLDGLLTAWEEEGP
jgi:hypothetical protein